MHKLKLRMYIGLKENHYLARLYLTKTKETPYFFSGLEYCTCVCVWVFAYLLWGSNVLIVILVCLFTCLILFSFCSCCFTEKNSMTLSL